MTTQKHPILSSSTRAVLLGLTLPLSALSLSACAVESEGGDISEAGAAQLRSAPVSECITISGNSVDDAMISNPPKNNNYGSHPLLRVGGKDESLLRFNLDAIPAEAMIDSATLKLYVNGGAGNNPINIHRATASWSESTVSFQSFDQQFAAGVEGVISPNSPNALKSANLTGLVTQWFTGAQANHGIVLETTGNQKTIFVSNEGGTAGYRPALEVCYTLPVEDYCDPDPCQNGGSCANGEDTYSCACPAGYEGTDCEIEIDECAANPCANGECSDGVNSYSCDCEPGWEGINCDVDTNECAGDPCGAFGICTDLIASYSCQCDAGYEGTNCEIDINECAGDPCQNGGSCTDGQNTYTCSCASGYEGDNCEIDTDDCAGATCQNDSTCVDGVASYTCACLPGWEGESCEIDIDDCSGDPCLNAGECTDLVNAYTCACAPGWDGDNCEIDIDECENNNCVNGQCNDLVNAYACVCNSNWEGELCDVPVVVDPCGSNPCENAGICLPDGDSFFCYCQAGWTGPTCATALNPCDPDPCENAGFCIPFGESFGCSCQTGWTGPTCSEAI